MFLGREERVEHAVLAAVRQAGAGVRHQDLHLVAAERCRVDSQEPLGHWCVVHRLAPVHHEIHHHLEQLHRVGRDAGKSGGDVRLDVDARKRDRALAERQRITNHDLDGQGLDPRFSCPQERAQTRDDVRGLLVFLRNVLEDLAYLLSVRRVPVEDVNRGLRVRQDRHELLAQLVRKRAKVDRHVVMWWQQLIRI